MSARSSLIPIILLVGATAVVLSCRDATPLGIAGPTPAGSPSFHGRSDGDDSDDSDDTDDSDGDQDADSLVLCKALPYDSVTQVIGPAGGVLEVGRNWLLVPRGALRNPVSITAVAPSDTVALIRFEPEGLRFQATALLVMKYDRCLVKRNATPRIALVTDSLHVVEFLASGESMLHTSQFAKGHKLHRHIVVGQLQHFSNYAVAW